MIGFRPFQLPKIPAYVSVIQLHSSNYTALQKDAEEYCMAS